MDFSNKSVLRNAHGHEIRHERVFQFLKIAVLLLIKAGKMPFEANEVMFRGWARREQRGRSVTECTRAPSIDQERA